MTRKRRTKKQAVLDALTGGQWVPGYELTRPSVGGSEGLRRLRGLRTDEGYKIESRRMENSMAHEYRLV